MAEKPIFVAVSTSARQLYLLLRCIAFTHMAEVYITPAGLRFATEESRVVQGLTMLEKSLFSTYTFNDPGGAGGVPSFQISLSALLETLQIFGISDATSAFRHQAGGFTSSYATAFTTPALAVGGTCRISYAQIGSPLCITIAEGGVTTTCELMTYEIPYANQDVDEIIPLDRSAFTMKIIMRSVWLHDAIAEISGMSPDVLVINASSISAPYFALEGHSGPFGDSTVEFMPEGKGESSGALARGKRQPFVTDTFSVNASPGNHGRVMQRYKFDLIKKAGRAMALASKVSMRQDKHGVLSLQFMIEVGESTVGGTRESNEPTGINAGGPPSGSVAFVDFRFVPLADEDDEEADETASGEELD